MLEFVPLRLGEKTARSSCNHDLKKIHTRKLHARACYYCYYVFNFINTTQNLPFHQEQRRHRPQLAASPLHLAPQQHNETRGWV